MWKHVNRAVMVSGLIGGVIVAISSRSIPASIIEADGYLVTNLKWAGWQHPPEALASRATDHWAVGLGIFLMLVALVLWLVSVSDRRADRHPKPVRYMTLFEAVHHLSEESEWGWKARQVRKAGFVRGCPVTMEINATLEAPIELQGQASREGTLVRIWGTRAWTAETEAINHSFWLSNGFHLDGCINSSVEGRSEARVYASNALVYERLRFDWDGVMKTWPRMNAIKRFILKRRMERKDAKWKAAE